MNNWRYTGIISILLLISFILIALTVASTLTQETTGATSSTSPENIDQMVDEVIDEISTYLQIKDQKGKYYEIEGQQKIEKIAMLISPLVSQEIDLTHLTIQLDNGETVRILTYDGLAENLNSQSIFEHIIWDSITGDNFGFITICDLDNSITDHDSINENSDNTYVVFKLPSDMTMVKRDKMIVTLFPSSGITRKTILEAPLPIRSVVTFE